jgi:hypothetical protein
MVVTRAMTAGCFAWSQWQVAGEVLSAVAAAGRCDEPGPRARLEVGAQA